jgi:ubiquinone/menaquinone biosynthesis C-methylase UbiE
VKRLLHPLPATSILSPHEWSFVLERVYSTLAVVLVVGPAREVACFSNANIIGVNINDFQIGRARRCAMDAGLENQVQFVKGDFMKLSELFDEYAFDASELAM